ncbi:MAG: isoprenoid biosynthesis glyoxalase ElbB [Planctomycetes bacterium]|nr:isoprenoid biosynthesis glyoxalase ElbB [Planctomycetota bacterium]
MALQVGVILSGCGHRDGAEIREAVLTLLAIDRAGAQARVFAPDVPQARVFDHYHGKDVPGERRNVLVEAARIARGDIRPLSEAKAADLDALVMPGGFGAALNLSTFATKGADCDVLPEVASLLRAMHAARKPIGAICIAPAVVAKALGAAHPRLTIGDDAGTAKAVEACGAVHEACPVDRHVVDRANKVVTTPAYMYDASLSGVAAGIERCVADVLAMATPAAGGPRR